MGTRLVIMEVPDTQTQDDIRMAIAIWNHDVSNREIRVIQNTSLIVGE